MVPETAWSVEFDAEIPFDEVSIRSTALTSSCWIAAKSFCVSERLGTPLPTSNEFARRGVGRFVVVALLVEV